jgi:hypothetical protein
MPASARDSLGVSLRSPPAVAVIRVAAMGEIALAVTW